MTFTARVVVLELAVAAAVMLVTLLGSLTRQQLTLSALAF
jgi:hypothetical protein